MPVESRERHDRIQPRAGGGVQTTACERLVTVPKGGLGSHEILWVRSVAELPKLARYEVDDLLPDIDGVVPDPLDAA